MKTFAGIVLDAWRDFRRAWPQLVLIDLLSRAAAFVLIAPAIGLLLELFLLGTDDGVLSDTDIVRFVLHPTGMLAVLVVGAVSLGVAFAEQGVLMVVGFGAAEDRRITYVDAIRYGVRYAPRLLDLAVRIVVRLMLLVVPFLVFLAGIYLTLLGEYDINFYLAERPPEFRAALALAAVVLVASAVVIGTQLARWILVLPLVLFEDRDGRRALAESRAATRGRVGHITLALFSWLGGAAVLSATATWLVGRVGRILVPDVGGSLALMAIGVAVTLVLVGLVNLAVAVVTASMLPLAVVRLYRHLGRKGELTPDVGGLGPLGARATSSVPGSAVLWGTGLLFLVVVVAGYVGARAVSEPDRVEIIAHRGASGAAPENTMAAFEQAIADGADWIELDVQEDADGVVVVAHDSDFMKVANVSLKVWEATAEDLEHIDIGSHFGPEFSGERVPTLREVLATARGKIGVVIELKYYGYDRSLESNVVEIVEALDMASEIEVMSLSLKGVRKIAALRPDWAYGLLNTVAVGDLTRLDLDFLALNASAATRSVNRRAHRRGMKLYVWTVNDPVQMFVMMSRGADGLITDEPATALQVMDFREQLGPAGRLIVWIAGETGLVRGMESASREDDA